MNNATISAIGLFSDIVGVLLLWKFGLPPDVRRDGASFLQLEHADEDEKKKARIFDFLSHTAIVLIILGFLMQLIGTLLPSSFFAGSKSSIAAITSSSGATQSATPTPKSGNPECAGSYEPLKCEALHSQLTHETAEKANARRRSLEEERSKNMALAIQSPNGAETPPQQVIESEAPQGIDMSLPNDVKKKMGIQTVFNRFHATEQTNERHPHRQNLHLQNAECDT